jgi:hypothetical protein
MPQEPIEKFWMVWGIQRGMPHYRHASKTAAQTEAKRLASGAPGELFVVLAAVDAFVSVVLPPEKVGLVKPVGALKPTDADIPF